MKTKSNKKNKVEDRCSFNELYNTKLDEFEKYYNKLPDKKAELKKLKSRKNQSSQKLIDRIKALENEIKEIESQTDMTEYLLDIHDVLKKKGENDVKRREKKKNESKTKNILDEMKCTNNIESYCVEVSNNEKEKLIDDYNLATTGVSKLLSQKSLGLNSDVTNFQCTNCGEDGVIIRCHDKQDRI